jgi:hypothetical protein
VRCAIAVARGAAAVAVGACGGNDHKAPEKPAPPPAKRPPADIAPGGGLAIGLTEINPDLFWHGKDVGAFAPWRDRLEALKPPLYPPRATTEPGEDRWAVVPGGVRP